MSDWAVRDIPESGLKSYMIPYATNVKPGDIVKIFRINKRLNYCKEIAEGFVLGNYKYHILIDVINEKCDIPMSINKIDLLMGDYIIKRIL